MKTKNIDFYSEIIDLIISKRISSKDELHRIKVELCRKYKLSKIPSDSEILARLPGYGFSDEEYENLLSLLRIKSVRTTSGVAIVAAMTSPYPCPHGRCTPCPGGPSSGTPQSYTGYEPATLRAILNDFDPFLQARSRLDQLRAIGHSIDKIDFIIMGGTFTNRDPYYQEWFVKRCYDAMNNKESTSLEEAKSINEKAESRCIGLTIETRPDWFRLQHADQALSFGATRIELGVQSVFDNVLNNIERGHTVIDSILATRIAKDTGFKVCYHMMPNLPGSDKDRDLETFCRIFSDSDFKPDMIKIYPTIVIKGTKLYEMWKKGDYQPLTTEEICELIAKIKMHVPEWIRIQRIQRDVPVKYVDGGVKKGNLRQLVERKMKELGLECRCIRCREIGHKLTTKEIEITDDNIELETTYYEASGSEEVFISLVDSKNDAIIGYLRLRDINRSHRFELKNPCMIIRELRVVGQELNIGKKSKMAVQHRGYGKELIREAERICLEEFDKKRLFVLSGIGVKDYYRRLGFKDKGYYLLKNL